MNHTKSGSFYLLLVFILVVAVLSCKHDSPKHRPHKPSIHLVQFNDLNNCNFYYYDKEGRIQSHVSTWLDKEFAFHIDSVIYNYNEESGRIVKSFEYRSYGYMSRSGHLRHLDTLQARYVYNKEGNLFEERFLHDTVRYYYRNDMLICRETYDKKQLTWVDSFKNDERGNNIHIATYWLSNGKYGWPTIENKRYDNKKCYMSALPEEYRKIALMTDVNNCTKILCGNYPCRNYTYKYNAEGYPVSGKAKAAAGVITKDSMWFKYATF